MGILPGGSYAEYVAAHKDVLIPIPDEFDYETAAAIPEAWLTAYQTLFFLGQARSGNLALIHAAASGVGTAIIQLAKDAGVRVVGTVGTKEKEQLCIDLGAEAVCNYKTGAFDEVVKELGGADVILDPVGASHFEKNLACVNRDGRWVLYGLMGGAKTEVNLGGLLAKRVTLTATTLRNRDEAYKAELVRSFV